MANLLLMYKGNPNLENFIFGRSPLHYAVNCGKEDCIKALLLYGANPLLEDR